MEVRDGDRGRVKAEVAVRGRGRARVIGCTSLA